MDTRNIRRAAVYLGVIFAWLLVCMKLGISKKSDPGMEELIYVSNPIEAGLPGHWVPISALKQALENKNVKETKHVIKPPKIIRKLPTNKIRTDKIKRTSPVFGAWQNEGLTKRTTLKSLNKTETFKKSPATLLSFKTIEDNKPDEHRTSTKRHETKIAELLLQEPKTMFSSTIHSRTSDETTNLKTTESTKLKETFTLGTKPRQSMKYTLHEITKSKTKLLEIASPVTHPTKITTENKTNTPEAHTQGRQSLLSNKFETSTSSSIGLKTSSMSRTKSSLKRSTLSMKKSSKPVTFTSISSPKTAHLTTAPSKTTSTISKITPSEIFNSPKPASIAGTTIPKTIFTDTSITQKPPSTKVLTAVKTTPEGISTTQKPPMTTVTTTAKTTPTEKSTTQKPPMTTVTTTAKTTPSETLLTPVSLSTTLSATAKTTPTAHSTTLTPQTISTKPAIPIIAKIKPTSHILTISTPQTTLTPQTFSTKPAKTTQTLYSATSTLQTTLTPQTISTTLATSITAETKPTSPLRTSTAQTTLTPQSLQTISTKPAISTTAKTKPTSHLTTSTPQTTLTILKTTTTVKTTPAEPQNTTPTSRPAIISTVRHRLKRTKSDPFY